MSLQSGQVCATCYAQQCCDVMHWIEVEIVWPGIKVGVRSERFEGLKGGGEGLQVVLPVPLLRANCKHANLWLRRLTGVLSVQGKQNPTHTHRLHLTPVLNLSFRLPHWSITYDSFLKEKDPSALQTIYLLLLRLCEIYRTSKYWNALFNWDRRRWIISSSSWAASS